MSLETLILIILLPILFYSIGKWLDSDSKTGYAYTNDFSPKNFVAGALGILMLAGLFWVLFVPNGICASACIRDFDFPIGGSRCDSSFGDCPDQVWGR